MFSVYADDKLFYSPRLLDERYAITEPQATLELNKAGSFTFNLPSINPMYSSLKKLKTIITIREDDEVLWKGRVLNDAKDFYNTKAVTCEGELAFLNDIQYEPHDYSKKGIKMGEYFKKLIEHYASECSEERMIKLGNVRGAFTDVLIYPKTTDYTNVWNLISGNLIGASTGKVGKDEVPTAENYPAVEWTTPEAKHAHIGDLYYDKSTGIGYRWTENSGGYYWDVIEDKQVQQALQNASRAQSTADGKVRCFSAQPYPPYEVGDLWVQGGSGDILCCQHDRESGSYVASDWVRASKYTDDTKAIEAGKTATDYIKDGAGGVQVGPNGSSNVTMTDEGLVFNGIRNLVPLWENADPTSGMAGGTVICSDGRLSSYAAIAIGCQEYYTSPFDSASTEGGLIQYTIVMLNGKEARCSYVWDKSRARKVTANKNGITFGPGGYYDTKKLDKWIWPWTDVIYGAKFDAHNQCCVPVVIYGFL